MKWQNVEIVAAVAYQHVRVAVVRDSPLKATPKLAFERKNVKFVAARDKSSVLYAVVDVSETSKNNPLSCLRLRSDRWPAALPTERPRNRIASHQSGHRLTEIPFQHRAPRNEGEFPAPLDNGETSAREIDMTPINALDP